MSRSHTKKVLVMCHVFFVSKEHFFQSWCNSSCSVVVLNVHESQKCDIYSHRLKEQNRSDFPAQRRSPQGPVSVKYFKACLLQQSVLSISQALWNQLRNPTIPGFSPKHKRPTNRPKEWASKWPVVRLRGTPGQKLTGNLPLRGWRSRSVVRITKQDN